MNTIARVATVCQGQRFFPSVEENRAHVCDLLELALRVRPDIVCLPENFSTAGLPRNGADARAEPLPGPTIDRVASYARRGRCYVICPLLTNRDGVVHNSAVILDRSGDILGTYDKLRPVTSSCDYTELEHGVAPGAGAGVFDTDFGRIGVRICFDVGFPEVWQQLKQEDARLVFWPSAYDGGMPITVYAALHRYYVVTSVRSERSRIIDPCGDLLVSTDRLSNIAWRDINLDNMVCHYDFNFGIPDCILADYGERVEIRSHIDDALFLVEPRDRAVTTAELVARYGFESADHYHARHRTAEAARATNGAPTPQSAAHGSRPIYAKQAKT